MTTSGGGSIKQVVKLFLYATIVGAIFFVLAALRNSSSEFWYLLYNLGLAWIPLVCSVWLVSLLRRHAWTDWLPLAITVVWLAFLPNTFYMITDYIHLHDVPRIDEVFDVLMFTSIILPGVLLGFASLGLIHRELRKRLPAAQTWRLIMAVLLVTSLAIYVGRQLRWNSWDIIINPAGIIFDVSDIIMYPADHGEAYIMTGAFFAVLATTYYLGWRAFQLLRKF